MPTMASFETRTNDYTNSIFSENNDLLMKDLPAEMKNKLRLIEREKAVRDSDTRLTN